MDCGESRVFNRNPAIFFWREIATFSGDSKCILIDALKEACARSKINKTIEGRSDSFLRKWAVFAMAPIFNPVLAVEDASFVKKCVRQSFRAESQLFKSVSTLI